MGLRIAFFGTDLFSLYSLRALHANRLRCNIDALDVITRPPKLTGRNRSIVKDALTAGFAAENGITVRRAENSEEINALNGGLGRDQAYNMAIAVSYGNLIPSEFLRSMTYPGLNVHPSLLPRYRGSSPLQTAILRGDQITGVSVQTLHPTLFDHGSVLYQSPEVSVSKTETFSSLRDKLGPIGAEGLVTVLAEQRYADLPNYTIPAKYPKSYAKKLKKEDCFFDPTVMSCDLVLRKYRALGPVYSYQICTPKRRPAGAKRVIFHDPELLESFPSDLQISQYCLHDSKIILRLLDGYISCSTIQLEGEKPETAVKFASSMKSRGIKDPKLVSAQDSINL